MDADEALNEYVKRLVLRGEASYVNGLPTAHPDRRTVAEHLEGCQDLEVVEADGSNGSYGCDTGCEYARLEASVRCPHRPEPVEVEYGWFGEMADIYDELDKIRNENEQ